MTIKSFIIAFWITLSTLSAAEVLGEDAMEQNSDLNLLISAYVALANDHTILNMRLYIRSLQAEIYHLVNVGEITNATIKLESVLALLDPIFKNMSEEYRERMESKSLNSLKDFIKIHI